MTISLTGAEWKAFYLCAETWPEGWYHEDVVILINGVQEVDFTDVADDATITVSSGDVYDSECNLVGSLASRLKKWRSAQNAVYMVVSIDQEKAEELKRTILSLGGKVVK